MRGMVVGEGGRSSGVLLYFSWLTGIDFEHRHQNNSHLFDLFRHVGQYNDASPKIRFPNRGKNW